VASKQRSNLGLAGMALLAFAAMMAWMLMGPSGNAPPSADHAPASAAAAPTATNRSAPTPTKPDDKAAPAAAAAVDLFAGAMPDFMVDAHARVLDKKWLDVEVQKQLYAYGQAHSDDARPQLLLAWDSVNREWWGMAVRTYRMAYRADPRAKDDPSMLRDLLLVASRFDRTEYREATEVLEEAFGSAALPRLDELRSELSARGELTGVARLQRLRDALLQR
jgi:hypothetical protein